MEKQKNHQRNHPISVPDFKDEWITQGLNEDAIKFCEKLGKFCSKGLTNSQIRNFYGEVKRLQNKPGESGNKRIMLQPKLAYASARNKNEGSTLFNKKLQPALKLAVKEDAYFQNFCDLLEAILSYHKVHGGS